MMSESTPCPCTRLIEPFVGGELPDDVCIPTMKASVRSAIRDGVVPRSEGWPVPLNGRRLGLVIREWAEEAPKRTLANLLAGSKDWDKEVESLRAHFEVWRERNPGAALDGWVDGTAWWKGNGDTLDPGASRYLARWLRRRGLPDTPATVCHLRAVAAGVTSPPLRRAACW